MRIRNCGSHCDINAKEIVSSDRGRCKHIAHNTSECKVGQFLIDGDVLTGEEKKCDWLVVNEDKKTAYYIELKGSDIDQAITQLMDTYKNLKSDLENYNSFFRVIYKTGSHSVNSSKVIKWKEKMGTCIGIKRAIVKNSLLEENI